MYIFLQLISIPDYKKMQYWNYSKLLKTIVVELPIVQVTLGFQERKIECSEDERFQNISSWNRNQIIKITKFTNFGLNHKKQHPLTRQKLFDHLRMRSRLNIREYTISSSLYCLSRNQVCVSGVNTLRTLFAALVRVIFFQLYKKIEFLNISTSQYKRISFYRFCHREGVQGMFSVQRWSYKRPQQFLVNFRQ